MRRPTQPTRFRLLHLGLALALAAAPGCRGASNLPTAPKLPETGSALFSVSILASVTTLEVARTVTLTLDGQDETGNAVAAPTAKWESSDKAVATVDSRGRVTGVKSGRVTITATTTNPAREATITLQVVGAGQAPAAGGNPTVPNNPDLPQTQPAPAPSVNWPPATNAPDAPSGVALTIYPRTNRLTVGESLRMIAYQGLVGSQAPAAAIWQSGDDAIATVDEAGVVTARKAGAVHIMAQSVAYPALTQEVTLTVVAKASAGQLQGIRISPATVSMNVGETFWLLAEVPTRTGSYDANIRWVAGDASLIRVSTTGQLTAIRPGKTTVTAIAATYDSGELSATIPVEIRNASSSGGFNP